MYLTFTLTGAKIIRIFVQLSLKVFILIFQQQLLGISHEEMSIPRLDAGSFFYDALINSRLALKNKPVETLVVIMATLAVWSTSVKRRSSQ